MRIGICWLLDYPLMKTTVRFERYIEGFVSLGHEAIMVATRTALDGFSYPAVVAENKANFREPSFWKSHQFDALVICTWLVNAEEMQAARSSIGCLIALSDSDGCIGIRSFPLTILKRMLVVQNVFHDKLRTAFWWLKQYLGLDIQSEREVIASCCLADKIIVYSPGAMMNLSKFFIQRGFKGIAKRIMVVPYPVGKQFEDQHYRILNRKDQIIAIGRWDDPQKDVYLLVQALKIVLKCRHSTCCTIIGAGGDPFLIGLQNKFPNRITLLGIQSNDKVMECLGLSRCLLSTSRWESGPIIASEALLMGCSLVGPDSIPSFKHFCTGKIGCGTLFSKRSGSSVARALLVELHAWDKGTRIPEKIADRWNGYFMAGPVCARILGNVIGTCTEDYFCSP